MLTLPSSVEVGMNTSYAPTHTRTQRTYPHAYACHKDGCLHINKTIAISRKAITAFTFLLNFGASSNETYRRANVQPNIVRDWTNELCNMHENRSKRLIPWRPLGNKPAYITSSSRKLQTVSRQALPDTGDQLSRSPLFYHYPNMGHLDYYVKSNQAIKG